MMKQSPLYLMKLHHFREMDLLLCLQVTQTVQQTYILLFVCIPVKYIAKAQAQLIPIIVILSPVLTQAARLDCMT